MTDPAAAAGVVLASASATRQALLRAAGVPFEVVPAAVDETEAKVGLRSAGASAVTAAESLAELKAMQVSRRRAGRLVIGADQMLDSAGSWLDKPGTRAAARAQLLQLRGQRHELVSAVAAVRDGRRLWHHCDRAQMTMRPFSETFLDSYLSAVGDEAFATVGAYRLEGLGAQLFARIEGDYFTILGLPLLPLLEFLREHRVLAS